ncbi:MAG: glycosyltransferase [Lachnospiraceae bacterium]|nr:glycosyltransferase [Lachnospiraceae bacterium]
MDFPVSISVIMSTYNTEAAYLKIAVESIIGQTFRDFEFIIIDDGSDNGSDAYLREISDERVRIITNPENLGITKSLNIGIRDARGKYIARMDADDLSLPTRLEKEFAFMEANPDVVVCGAQEDFLTDEGVIENSKKHKGFSDMESYRVKMLFMNPGPIHPTAMIRHETLLVNHILYDEKLIHAQDYGMWETLSHFGRICALDEVLLYRRKAKKRISVTRRDLQIKCDKMTQKKMLSELLGEVTDEELDLHYRYSTGYYKGAGLTPEIEKWYDRLLAANETKRIYDRKKFKKGIIDTKKRLIRYSFTPEMQNKDKLSLIFEHLPFMEGVRMIFGNIKRGIW